jgi:hypothetical protein
MTTGEQVQATFLTVLKDYGFATVVALACLYVGRQDVLLPLVKAHTQFLEKLAQTQIEIATAVQEQTRLLYAMQPRRAGEIAKESP